MKNHALFKKETPNTNGVQIRRLIRSYHRHTSIYFYLEPLKDNCSLCADHIINMYEAPDAEWVVDKYDKIGILLGSLIKSFILSYQ